MKPFQFFVNHTVFLFDFKYRCLQIIHNNHVLGTFMLDKMMYQQYS